MSPTPFKGAHKPQAKEIGIIPISEDVNVIVGNTATVLTKPATATSIVVSVTEGSFFFKAGTYNNVGDNPAFPTDPAVTAADGSAAFPVTGEKVFAIGDFMTVKGSTAEAKIYYYWI